jgi:hypothetical protein
MPTNCQSHQLGHHIHWIPATRAWNDKPRHPITHIETNPDDTLTIVYNGQTKVMHYHDPKYLRAVLERNLDEKWLAVGDTGAIQTNDQVAKWIHLSPTPVKNCADAYIKEIHDNFDKALDRTKRLIQIKEFPEQAKKAQEFLTHLEYIKTLKYWDEHVITFDLFGDPQCSCTLGG